MIISVYNHKGGTGKTTTSINIGKSLSDLGNSVLLVDLDPQANLTYSLGIEKNEALEVKLSAENIVSTEEGFDVIPNFTSPQFLVDYQFPSPTSLKEELSELFLSYDFVLIDCPPSMNLTVVNALLTSDGVLIPALLDALSLEALRQVFGAIDDLLKEYKYNFSFIGILPVMVDRRRQLTNDVKDYIQENYDVSLFENNVRMNVKIAEAPSHGKSIFEYYSKCKGATDYMNVTKEFLEKVNN